MGFTPDLSRGRYIKTFGNSMAPLLKDGDVVYYRRVKFNELTIDDIVIIKIKKRYRTHRIIYKNDIYIVTKGDNTIDNDGRIYPEQVYGLVFKVKRGKQIFSPHDVYKLQSLFYSNEIQRVSEQLKKNNITFIFLKGLPLHLYYSRHNPKRIYNDCDILISPHDLKKVMVILEKLNYKYIDISLNEYVKTDIRPEYSFYTDVHGIPVLFDIHTQPVFLLTQVSKLDHLYPTHLIEEMTIEMLNSRRTIILKKKRYPMLAVAFLVVYLGLHFFHHNFRGSYRLALVDEIIRNELLKRSNQQRKLLWKEILLIIVKYKLESFIYPSFIFLKKYFKTPIPSYFLTSIKPIGYKLIYTKRNILPIDIFTEQKRILAGIDRFKHIFILSGRPFYRKILILTDYQVLSMIVHVLKANVINLLNK